MTEPQQPSASQSPVKVLYLAGWGRSGTTILANTLGSFDGVFASGELQHMWQFGFVQQRKCGCGVPFPECGLWQAVFRAGFGDDLPDPHEMLRLQQEEIKVLRTPALIASALRGRMSPGFRRYTDVRARIYRGIAEVTGARLIVDPSKRPSDAVVVGRVTGVDPYMLHLVRDPRAVGHSWRRRTAEVDTDRPAQMTQHGLLMNTLHWLSWNVGAEASASLYPRGHYLRMRYEDMMVDPRQSVEQILRFVGEPVVAGPFRDERTVELGPNHTVAGNPNRFRTGPVELRNDERWRDEQRPVDRWGNTVLTLPLLMRYHYPLAVTRNND